MNKNELIKSVEQWVYDRGLHEADPGEQYLKLIEEVGELASGIARSDEDLIKDSIGDIAVVIIGLCVKTGIDATDVFDVEWHHDNIPEYNTSLIMYVLDKMSSSFHILVNSDGNWINADMCVRRRNFVDRISTCVHKLGFLALSLNLDLIDCLGSAYTRLKTEKEKW